MKIIYRLISLVLICYLTYITSLNIYSWLFPKNLLTTDLFVPKSSINNIYYILYSISFLFYTYIYLYLTPYVQIKLNYYDSLIKRENMINTLINVIGGVIIFILSLMIMSYIKSIIYINGNLGISIVIILGIIGIYFTDIVREDIPFLNKYKVDIRRKYILDTSSFIDGRVIEMYKIGLINGLIIIPEYVLKELQIIADTQDSIKRAKGQRGLENVTILREWIAKYSGEFQTISDDTSFKVDDKLLEYCQLNNDTFLITTDYNLTKLFETKNLNVININLLITELKTELKENDLIKIMVKRKGSNRKQGTGNLEDGSLVIIEDATDKIGEEVDCEITKITYNSSGRIIFAKLL